MQSRIISIALLLILLLGISIFPTQAQGNLTYGSGQTGTISATSPVLVYTFNGTAGDSVTIQVIGLTDGLQPAISLNTITGLQLASSNSDSGNLASSSARINIRLNNDGIHTIIVTSLGSTVGDFAIRLDGVPTTEETTVASEETADSSVTAGNSFLIYTVPANETQPLVAFVSADSDSTVFSVSVITPNGMQLALINGLGIQPALATLPPTTGNYTLEITVNSTTDATISVNVAPLGAPPVTDDVAPTQPVIEATPTATVVQGENQPTVVPTATTAQNVQPTAPPTATTAQQQNNPPTATQPANNQPTATFTPSYTPTTAITATFTPSYTPTTAPVQIAPEDSRFNNELVIPLDNTVSVLDFVSYPDGDTEDRVRYSVSGMNNNSSLSGGRARLVISVSCFGDNTDQVEIFTGGQTYSCGDTIVDREVTADSDTGSLIITAVGGSGTYVQWVLTGTATRVN